MATPGNTDPTVAARLTENRLLAFLPRAERDRLAGSAEIVRVEVMEILAHADEPLAYAYFPITGLISIVAIDVDGAIVEVGTAGNEGMAGLPAFLGAPASPFQTMGEVPGEHVRVPMRVLLAAAAPGTTLHALLLRYAQAFSVLAGQSAACNRLHPLEERCARWLLMVHDRAPSDTFLLTHEVLGQMLGTRRASVTVALGILQTAGFISYRHGEVTIRNREGLKEAACECYAVIQHQFTRLFPDDPRENDPQ
jgi:CRP-like cAMP-binding protein